MSYLSLSHVEVLFGNLEIRRDRNKIAFKDIDGWISIQPDGSEQRRVEGHIYGGEVWNGLGLYELAEDLGNGFCVWKISNRAFLRKYVE